MVPWLLVLFNCSYNFQAQHVLVQIINKFIWRNIHIHIRIVKNRKKHSKYL